MESGESESHVMTGMPAAVARSMIGMSTVASLQETPMPSQPAVMAASSRSACSLASVLGGPIHTNSTSPSSSERILPPCSATAKTGLSVAFGDHTNLSLGSCALATLPSMLVATAAPAVAAVACRNFLRDSDGFKGGPS